MNKEKLEAYIAKQLQEAHEAQEQWIYILHDRGMRKDYGTIEPATHIIELQALINELESFLPRFRFLEQLKGE